MVIAMITGVITGPTHTTGSSVNQDPLALLQVFGLPFGRKLARAQDIRERQMILVVHVASLNRGQPVMLPDAMSVCARS